MIVDGPSISTSTDGGRNGQQRIVIACDLGLRAYVADLCAGYSGPFELSFREGPADELRNAILETVPRERSHCAPRVDAIVSREPLTHREQRRGLQGVELSQRALVPVVHASNPLDRLAFAQLGAIIDGRSRSWFEWNRNPASIEVLTLDPSSSRQTRELQRFWPSRQPVSTQAFANDLELLRASAKRPSAIALVDATAIDRYRRQHEAGIRELSIDNVPPSEARRSQGEWPLSMTLRWITRVDAGPRLAALSSHVRSRSHAVTNSALATPGK
ncbi:MAG: hypothetical protein H6832_13695 [Planctomycetes bacterium]|nr:hypothetical protein [Planctomycetota bacterium]MCB9891291.1 hypothetical protein [Planctomycetota bacterium]MCB9919450.1 hypothetical protein [Planctomycetota bacterium]